MLLDAAPTRDATGVSAGLAVVRGGAERRLGLVVMAGVVGLVLDPVGVPGLAEGLLGRVGVLLGRVVAPGGVRMPLGPVVIAGVVGVVPDPVEAPGTAERLTK